MLFAVLFYLLFLLFFFEDFLRLQFFVLFVDGVDVLAVLHVFGSAIFLLLLFLPNVFFGFEAQEFSLLHFLLVLVHVLLDDLLVLFPQIFLELLQLFLLFLLLLSLLLFPRAYLVLN